MPQPPPGFHGLGLIFLIACVVVVLPALWVKWQHDRQRFALMKLAIEKGLTGLPFGLPIWLVSMRQGVMVLVLGIGLLLTGGLMLHFSPASAMSGRMMPRPFAGHLAEQHVGAAYRGPEPGGPAATSPSSRPGLAPGEDRFNPPDRPFPPGSWKHRPGGWRPGGPAFRRRGMFIARGDAMAVQHAALALIGIGIILVLLAIARIGFAFLERRFTTGPVSGSTDHGSIRN